MPRPVIGNIEAHAEAVVKTTLLNQPENPVMGAIRYRGLKQLHHRLLLRNQHQSDY